MAKNCKKSLEINVEADDEFNATVVNLVNLAHGAGHIFRECSNVALKTQLLKLVFRMLNLDGISIGYQLNFPFSEMQQIPDISRWGPKPDTILTQHLKEMLDLSPLINELLSEIQKTT